MNYKVFSLFLCLCLIHTMPHALTVDEAYAAVPHQRTVYKTDMSRLSAQHRNYLQKLFVLTDDALVLRIRFMRGERDDERYQDIILQLRQLTPPAQAESAHRLIIRAVQLQHQYFLANDAKNSKQQSSLMHQSHRLLINAYNELKKKLPDSGHNQKAYFDHLCALDFI